LLPTLRRGTALAELTIKTARKRASTPPAETCRSFKIVAAFEISG
jgi:hypothetical protein